MRGGLLLLAASARCEGCGIVFEHAGTLTLDGKTCALHAEGVASALPMGAEPYTLQAEIKTTQGGSRGIMSWGTFTDSGVNALRLNGASGESLMNCAPLPHHPSSSSSPPSPPDPWP